MKSTTITGPVLRGHGHGDALGAKTANLDIALAHDLTKGLYNCTVQLKDQTYNGLLYYGHNSLTNEGCLEVHLLNFTGDLYNQTLTVFVGQFIRAEKKFSSSAELKKQIAEDLSHFE